MLSIFALGFLIGLRHTLEADHVAAVATLTTQTASVRQAVPLGLLWGAGHTLSLGCFGLASLLLGAALPQDLALYLELAVGVMLIGLGADVLIRMIRQRIHFHAHRHHGGVVHFHAHGHEQNHNRDHDHIHLRGPAGALRLRAFLIGIMHGMAGSAVLVVLTLQAVPSVTAGLGYIALFGAGSIFGMAALSAAIAWPLAHWGRPLSWLHNTARVGTGVLTIGLGIAILFEGSPIF
ncbi:MAG: urease accessory protein [Proteobacteria bacterium]|nr:urease accessory protein [Pseudomonadota bacterium]